MSRLMFGSGSGVTDFSDGCFDRTFDASRCLLCLFVNMKTFSAVGFGQDKTPFLSTQQNDYNTQCSKY